SVFACAAHRKKRRSSQSSSRLPAIRRCYTSRAPQHGNSAQPWARMGNGPSCPHQHSWRIVGNLPGGRYAMLVVAGATGRIGGAVAATLLAARAKVRVLVRDSGRGAPWAAHGAELAVASLD